MENHYFLIRIEDKLRSLTRFTGSSGAILYAADHIYAFPEEMVKTFPKPAESVGTLPLQLHKFLGARQDARIIDLQSGKLIFLNPSISVEEVTLQFLGNQLEEEIHLSSLFDDICQASIAISSNLNLKTLLHIVMSLTERLLKNEVSAVMLIKPDKKDLYWEVSRGEKSELFEGKLTLQLGRGIAGNVAVTGEAVLLNDVREDPRWDDSFDKMTGFQSRSLICVPIKFRGNILGVIEVINKKEGDFTPRDLRILEILSTHTGVAVENAMIHGQLEEAYEELTLLDKAKERVINHLGHELKTPLALISGVLERISRLYGESPGKDLEKAITRGQRNVERLLELQDKIDDILNQRSVDEQEKILSIIESAAGLVEECAGVGPQSNAEFIERISSRIESLFCKEELHMEKVLLDDFLKEICAVATSSMTGRDLTINRNFEKDIYLIMDRGILRKSCIGLIKNAIENTPDEGKIDVTVKSVNGEIRIEVRDYGIGITPENQRFIFGGFFHIQDTNHYASKRPYQFNAGGTGSELLRIRTFSERFGFEVGFESKRCTFIPTDNHLCPGKISECGFIRDKSECFSAGGSSFSLTFPSAIFRNPPTVTH